MRVIRYSKYVNEFMPNSGDYLMVGDIDLGGLRDLYDEEYRRTKSVYKMRPLFYTTSPYWREILELADSVRGTNYSDEK